MEATFKYIKQIVDKKSSDNDTRSSINLEIAEFEIANLYNKTNHKIRGKTKLKN